MREILQVCAGQCGTQMGLAFLTQLCFEHRIDATGSALRSTTLLSPYFTEISPSLYRPRAILFDLEPGAIDSVRAGEHGHLFTPENCISGSCGAGNNWARGHYTDGYELVEKVAERARKEAERCDGLQGIQIHLSLGGGTGSGAGTRALLQLKEDFPRCILAVFAVLPSPKVSDVVVEPYNTVLGLHPLTETADAVVLLDNEALYRIALVKFRVQMPTYRLINRLVSRGMSGATATLRVPGQLNSTLRRLASNLVPFRSMPYLTVGEAPLLDHPAATELLEAAMTRENQIAACDPATGRYLAATAMFRCTAPLTLASGRSVDYLPDSFKSVECALPLEGVEKAVTLLGNSTAVWQPLSRVCSMFARMYQKKTFLQFYPSEGMDDMEWTEAEESLQTVIEDYKTAEQT